MDAVGIQIGSGTSDAHSRDMVPVGERAVAVHPQRTGAGVIARLGMREHEHEIEHVAIAASREFLVHVVRQRAVPSLGGQYVNVWLLDDQVAAKVECMTAYFRVVVPHAREARWQRSIERGHPFGEALIAARRGTLARIAPTDREPTEMRVDDILGIPGHITRDDRDRRRLDWLNPAAPLGGATKKEQCCGHPRLGQLTGQLGKARHSKPKLAP